MLKFPENFQLLGAINDYSVSIRKDKDYDKLKKFRDRETLIEL